MAYQDTGQSQSDLKDRLQKLDEIESKVMQIMQSAGGTLNELSKDVPSQKQIELHARNFRNAVRDVELELISQLNYLNQVLAGLPYEKNVYKETVELTISAERLRNSLQTDPLPDSLAVKGFACDIPPEADVAESDPAVTSTVNEADLCYSSSSSSSSDKTEVPKPLKPHWRFCSLATASSSHVSEDVTPETSVHEFESPEYEFDEELLDLQGDPDADYLWSTERDNAGGRMTPEGFIDEDFERELGWREEELSIQEVIDAEFRDISRLGIIQVGGRDHEGRKVIACFACRLPCADLIDHDRLLNFRKNLKSLIIVYPTRTVRVLWNLFSAFVSVKMKKKLHYVKNLKELEAYLPVSHLNLPLRIRDYDKKVGLLGIPLSIDPSAVSVIGDQDLDDPPYHHHQQFGVSLQYIKANNGGRRIPIVVEDTITYLRGHGLQTVGLFIKPTHVMALRDAQSMYNRGDYVDLCELNDPHLAAHLLKSFLADLKEPLLTFDLYEGILKACSQTSRHRVLSIRRLLTVHLPRDNYDILEYIFRFLTEVLEHSSKNMVTAANLSVALAPTLIRPHPDYVTPSQSLQNLIISFTQLCITHFESVFART